MQSQDHVSLRRRGAARPRPAHRHPRAGRARVVLPRLSRCPGGCHGVHRLVGGHVRGALGGRDRSLGPRDGVARRRARLRFDRRRRPLAPPRGGLGARHLDRDRAARPGARGRRVDDLAALRPPGAPSRGLDVPLRAGRARLAALPARADPRRRALLRRRGPRHGRRARGSSPSPWAMGITFLVGQLCAATVLRRGSEEATA